ncbi:5-formyltetrahydrofolate cyclo-ligase [Providencia rettgeri]|uniref:5-formyltetrahydrofolate cyclo-ligase n=1 Tax=Providencia TaxID=586 RepID=UPI00065E5ECC|nr:5-formyltetrahydrofolate cyclo-ligase [Providencia rettgeri]ELR5177022.1 5-formyltetrahydrofolate cyclo-ligase [Providencia rettgeri]ELR5261548.1 5-formyltetrahydrofolate cyclo-ligase [Providencia rettgeri]MDK3008632.1 5-formyltetrahydrofolate cyclo-ligase [Providencia rettgeri]
MQDALSTQRQQVRQSIRQARRQLTTKQQQLAAQLVMKNALQHPKINSAKCIALFLSFDGEIDTRPLISALWEQGKQVYLPVLHPFSRHHLLFLRYHTKTQLVKNRFNIDEPPLNVQDVLPIEKLDIMFIPLVAFDSQGQRLGMGGGFYDRTLAHWQQTGFYPIGLAHDCQQVEALPVAHWDIPLPEIITPQKIWRW